MAHSISPHLILAITCLFRVGCHSQFVESWSSSTSNYFRLYATHGTSQSGFIDTDSEDGASLRLNLNPNPPPGPNGSPHASTTALQKFGTYWTRAKAANCSNQPKAGVVTGIFTYFNNGGDRNGNGLPDNSEIDVEFLCAQPEVIYLTIWTDYAETNPETLRSVSRVINLRTGTIISDCYKEDFEVCHPLSDGERQPRQIQAIPDFNSAAGYYSYGWEMRADGVRYMLKRDVNDQPITLWDYKGPAARIPADTMYFMHNVWHTSTWPPVGDPTAIQRPTTNVLMFVDSTSYEP